MTTAVFTHAICLDHDTGAGHPERRARLEAIHDLLKEPEWKNLQIHDAPVAMREWLEYVHPAEHVDRIESAAPKEGAIYLDSDTIMAPHSYEAALRAAGAICAAVDQFMSGDISNGFCAVRPPGHHAELERAMGFCLFNNIAIGARHAQKHHNIKKIAIVDFDVHHGNGTQAAFWNDADILFISSHEAGNYPGTGFAHETGAHNNILNLPLPPYSGSRECRAIYRDSVFPRLRDFKPELILMSAGFDAHARDPLASLQWSGDDFYFITKEIKKIAQDLGYKGVLSTLEGGYDLVGLKEGVAAHLRAMQEED